MSSLGLEEAKHSGERFRADLEHYLKRFSPEGFLPAAAAKIAEVLDNKALLPKWPPHFLLHSMEAYCGFCRGHRTETVDEKVLAKIVNVYSSYVDPLQTYVFEQATLESVELGFIQMQRQQFPVQHSNLSRGRL